MESKQSIFILQIYNRASYEPQHLKILYDVLHHGNSLHVAYMLLATETKVKKKDQFKRIPHLLSQPDSLAFNQYRPH